MDIRWLPELSKDIGNLGVGPTKTELLAMQTSLSLLCQKAGHDVAHFWGKVRGTERNYLVAICYTGGLLGTKTAYASLDGVSWFGLPLVTDRLLHHCQHIRSRITGNPLTKTTVYHPRKTTPFTDLEPLVPPKPRKEEEEEEEEEEEQREKNEEEEEDQEEEEDLPEYTEVIVSEDQRLACIVHRIYKNGPIFPQDALLWKDADHVKVNPIFNGVTGEPTIEDFCRLDPSVRGESARAEGLVDTMPLLSEDLPSRGWVLSTTKNSDTITITSRLWPGYVFVSKGKLWGSVYMGTGERNTDFLFATD